MRNQARSGNMTHVLVDFGEEPNIITKLAMVRLGLSYNPSSTFLKTVNALLTLVCRVSHGVSITLGM